MDKTAVLGLFPPGYFDGYGYAMRLAVHITNQDKTPECVWLENTFDHITDDDSFIELGKQIAKTLNTDLDLEYFNGEYFQTGSF